MKQKRCKKCHKWFIPTRSYNIYCSIRCRKEQTEINRKLRQEQKRIYFKKQRCKYCRHWFQLKRRNSSYCSYKCMNTHAHNKLNAKRKQQAVDYKGGKCQRCGYNKCVAALEFHHRNPKLKEIYSNDLQKSITQKSMDSIKKELDKCDLLCANCHREVHAEKVKR